MLRAILRNVQFTLLLSASLLVLLAFQRLQNDDLFSIGQFQHADPNLDRHDIIGIRGRHSKIFSTNVIEIGLFRFVVPFRWESAGSDGEEITAAGPKAPAMRRKIVGRRKSKKSLLKPGNIDAINNAAAKLTRTARDLETGGKSTVEGNSVAYLVPILTCPSEELELTEGLAVLRQSIVSAHNSSEYKYKVFVVVSHDTQGCAIEPASRNLGFEVITMPADGEFAYIILPENQTDNFTEAHNEEISSAPFSHALSDYDVVVLLRKDSLVLKPLDSLFGALLRPKELLPSLETSELFNRPDQKTKEPYEVDVFATKDNMDFYVAKRGWTDLFRLLFEMQAREIQNSNSPINATLSASNGRAHLKRLYARRQHQRTQRSTPGLEYEGDTNSVLWLDSCLFSRRKKDSGGHCDFGAPFGNSWVAFSGSCSPPWGCNGHEYDGGAEGDYCGELHRAWFRYRTQLDQSSALEQKPLMKGARVESLLENRTYGTYCKHGGVGGYVRYDPQNHLSSRVARFLRSVGWS